MGAQNVEEYARLICQVESWHEAYEHDKIIDALLAIPAEERGYDLTCLLARAYNNIGHPRDPDYFDRMMASLDLLNSVEAEGWSDTLWQHRVGYALFHLNRLDDALPYFERAVKLDPDDDYSRYWIEECHRILDDRFLLKPVNKLHVAMCLKDAGWPDTRLDNGDILTGSGDFTGVISIDDDTMCCRSEWNVAATGGQYAELLQACNEWNIIRHNLKVFVDQPHRSAAHVVAEYCVFVGSGTTRDQLAGALDAYIQGTLDFYDFIVDRAPDLTFTHESA